MDPRTEGPNTEPVPHFDQAMTKIKEERDFYEKMSTSHLVKACAAHLHRYPTHGLIHGLMKRLEAFEEAQQTIAKINNEPAPSQPVMRPALIAFATMMEEKLKKNDHKTEWAKLPVAAHLRRLKNEIAELEMAIDYETPADVMRECADISNFSLFIWDITRRANSVV